MSQSTPRSTASADTSSGSSSSSAASTPARSPSTTPGRSPWTCSWNGCARRSRPPTEPWTPPSHASDCTRSSTPPGNAPWATRSSWTRRTGLRRWREDSQRSTTSTRQTHTVVAPNQGPNRAPRPRGSTGKGQRKPRWTRSPSPQSHRARGRRRMGVNPKRGLNPTGTRMVATAPTGRPSTSSSPRRGYDAPTPSRTSSRSSGRRSRTSPRRRRTPGTRLTSPG